MRGKLQERAWVGKVTGIAVGDEELDGMLSARLAKKK